MRRRQQPMVEKGVISDRLSGVHQNEGLSESSLFRWYSEVLATYLDAIRSRGKTGIVHLEDRLAHAPRYFFGRLADLVTYGAEES
jgi:hypothetical protein